MLILLKNTNFRKQIPKFLFDSVQFAKRDFWRKFDADQSQNKLLAAFQTWQVLTLQLERLAVKGLFTKTWEITKPLQFVFIKRIGQQKCI
jgi:hypothetical protein